MMTIDEIVVACRVRRADLNRWVEAGWLLPVEVDGAWQFAEIDLARARLIRDLRRDMGINEAALPLILDLIDRHHATERRLRRVLEALSDQPEDLRRVALRKLAG